MGEISKLKEKVSYFYKNFYIHSLLMAALNGFILLSNLESIENLQEEFYKIFIVVLGIIIIDILFLKMFNIERVKKSSNYLCLITIVFIYMKYFLFIYHILYFNINSFAVVFMIISIIFIGLNSYSKFSEFLIFPINRKVMINFLILGLTSIFSFSLIKIIATCSILSIFYPVLKHCSSILMKQTFSIFEKLYVPVIYIINYNNEIFWVNNRFKEKFHRKFNFKEIFKYFHTLNSKKDLFKKFEKFKISEENFKLNDFKYKNKKVEIWFTVLFIKEKKEDIYSLIILLDHEIIKIENINSMYYKKTHPQIQYVSHKFKTSLNGILGAVYLLKGRISPEFEFFITVAELCSYFLLNSVNTYIDYFNLKLRNFKLTPDLISFSDFENDLLYMYKKQAEENEIKLVIDFSNSPQKFYIDKKIIRQILISLIEYSFERCSRGTSIEIKTLNLKNIAIRFSIIDSGEKIDQYFLSSNNCVFKIKKTSAKIESERISLLTTMKILKIMGSKLCMEHTLEMKNKIFFDVTLKSKLDKNYVYSSVRNIPNLERNELVQNIESTLNEYSNSESFKAIKKRKQSLLDPPLLKRNFTANKDEYIPPIKRPHSFSKNKQKNIINEELKDEESKNQVISHLVNAHTLTKRTSLKNLVSFYPEIQNQLNGGNNLEFFNLKKSHQDILILIIGAKNLSRELFVELMKKKSKFRLLEANCCEDAYLVVKKELFNLNLIFIDLSLSQGIALQNITLISQLKKSVQLKIPIIGITYKLNDEDTEKFLQSGIDKLIEKPIQMNDLEQIFKSYFNDICDSYI